MSITARPLLGPLLLALAGLAVAAPDAGNLEALRGSMHLDRDPAPARIADPLKDQGIQDREYIHQPPLVPHQVRGYEVDLKVNQCLSCHGWKNAADRNAPRVSPTHYESRDGLTLSDISPRRYFCLQCHVPQTGAKPLVENTFTPVESLR
ncbi:nitrate reductase cytochrome c-type subunit [Oceanimonas doudoroffii]|uniref:Periplasmic nitrate reductase, electron transfer subunit n=1 Tax=Oceanimonas doudoroffii TaxID=84158 RepID=A0A233RHD4_9GAMM|nr:nitrate reductase cytochrome c-type subunit [Oceanimonas doudoroffii]OXY82810.1 periplasmic nitrate reductase electron transfer subunit [Oceanimonas doudoroffii]